MSNSLGVPLDRMPNVDKKVLFSELKKLDWLDTWYYYCVDSGFRKTVAVRKWFKDWSDNNTLELPIFEGTDDYKAKQCLKWVRSKVQYVGDKEKWGVSERWTLPDETLLNGCGDCEDGAILLYSVFRYNGFSDDQVFIVCGDVKGGGHCYVTYISSFDAVEYTLDWCYWTGDSLKVAYGLNPNYNFGKTEWFRFNASGSYVKR